jgi:hypothetical protein
VLLITACAKEEFEGEQSIQELVSETSDFKDIAVNASATNQTAQKSEGIATIPAITSATEIRNETPIVNKKCANSAILYDGCKWTDQTETKFDLKIISASKRTIPGLWFFITGESGGTIYIKKPGDILAGGRKSYPVDYEKLVAEIGRVTKFEILPIEVSNGTAYACLNQHVYTIPDTYCKPSEPIKVG